MRDGVGAKQLQAYVPALVDHWAPGPDDPRHRRVSGSLALADISGFTRLTERLAAGGKVGAEQMSDMLDATFTGLLTETLGEGGDLVKWGGDAMLLLFDGPGHASRAARAAHRMRSTLAAMGGIRLPSGTVRLRMSVGVHSGQFDFFLVGDPVHHRELLVVGPGVSRTVAMDGAASAGQVALSSATARRLGPRELGASIPGGRLLRAAPAPVERRGSAAPAVPVVPVTDAGGALSPPIRRHLLDGAPEPEHRLVTVAFVAFGGTDALVRSAAPQTVAAALDAVVRNVQQACADHDVTFFETDVDRDGGRIMLTAGAPRTSDHDEERMLRVARQVLDRAGMLSLRVGVNRGHVFAGDFGPPFRRTYSVKGDAINVAARVTARAAPGQLLATPEVLDRSRTVFTTVALPPFAVKGKARPVQAAAVGELVGPRGTGRPTIPVVGRDAELAVLHTALADARTGAARVVELVGEGGIGKSRLAAELVARNPDVTVVSAPGDEYGSATAYLPFRRLLREALAVPPDAGEEETARWVAERVGRVAPGLVPWLPLLGAAMNVDLPATPETADLDGPFRKRRLESVVTELLAATLTAPTLLLVEDCHLLDDASADLLGHLCDHLDGRPWLVLATRRAVDTGFVPPAGAPLTSVHLRTLDAAAARDLVQAVTAARDLTPAAVASLASRSGGHPLFLEALLVEAARAGSVAALPESVEGLVTSQIDRLDPGDRLVLRYAAVFGTEIDEPALDALLEAQGATVPAGALTRLADFLVRDGDRRLRFHNAVLRDVAYEGLPYRRRRTLHAHVGRAIEDATDDPDDRCELLSLHFFHAGMHERAWRYSRLAAERALEKYAHVEAVELLERAVGSVVPSLGLAAAEVSRTLEQLADSRFLAGGSHDAREAYEASRRMVRGDAVRTAVITEKEARIDIRHRRFPQALRRISRGLHALDGIDGPAADVARSLLARRYAYCRFSQGRIDDALHWAGVARTAALRSADDDALAQAYEMLNAIHAGSGRAEPEPFGALALAAYTALGNLPRQGHCLNNLAVQAFTDGRWDAALALYRRAADLFRRIGDAASEGNAAFNEAELLVCQRRHAEAAGLLPTVLRVARAVRDDELVALALREQARTLASTGDVDGAVAVLADARARFDELGERGEVLATARALAEVLLDAGRTQEAGAAVEDLVAGRGDDLSASEHRVVGRHHLAEGRVEEAERALLLGLDLAARHPHAYEEGLLLLEVAEVRRRTGQPYAVELARGRDLLGAMGVLLD